MKKKLILIILILVLSGCLSNEDQMKSYAKSFGIEEGAEGNFFSEEGVRWYFDKYDRDTPKYQIELNLIDVYSRPFVFAIMPDKEVVLNSDIVTFQSRSQTPKTVGYEEAVESFIEKKLTGKEVLLVASLKGYENALNKKVTDLTNNPDFVIKKLKLPEVDISLIATNLEEINKGWCDIERKSKTLPSEVAPTCEEYLDSLRERFHPKQICENNCFGSFPSQCTENCCEYITGPYPFNPKINGYNMYLVLYFNQKKTIESALKCDLDIYNQIKDEKGW